MIGFSQIAKKPSPSALSLEPASPAVPAAAENEHDQDDEDKEQGVVHFRLCPLELETVEVKAPIIDCGGQ